jgi:hypothetical protein
LYPQRFRPAGRPWPLRVAPSPAKLAMVHAAVREWCAVHGHELRGVRWEIYGHWLEDQDPALFETEVYGLLDDTHVERD